MKYLVGVLFFSVLISCQSKKEAQVNGELKKWHTVELVFEGPETSEMDENNPFLNYRLDVTFSNGEKEYVVPGSCFRHWVTQN